MTTALIAVAWIALWLGLMWAAMTAWERVKTEGDDPTPDDTITQADIDALIDRYTDGGRS